jgi:hypothetical protein
MRVSVGVYLGAPGVYGAPPLAPDIALGPIRLDVTGFVGVAWRGPVNEPVPVTSWSQFIDRFGSLTDPDGRTCPGLLPLAVRAFFDQGGVRAWVNRIGPVTHDPLASAELELTDLGARLVAAGEGSWGDRLRATLEFDTSGSFRPPPAGDPGVVRPGELAVPDAVSLPDGSLVLLGGTTDDPFGTLHWVTGSLERPLPRGGRLRMARLDPPPPEGADLGPVTVITGTLLVRDGDPTLPRVETITGLGLHPAHPRYPPAVLQAESRLVRAGQGWTGPLVPDRALIPVVSTLLHGGRDRFAEIDGDSLFDADGADSDPLDERVDHRGVDLAGRIDELGLLCVPDLTWQWRAQPGSPPDAPKPASNSQFQPCTPDPAPVLYASTVQATTQLEPQSPDDLAEILRRQQRLVDVAVLRRRFVALLDAPSGLSVADVSTWRSHFDTSFAAAYHPWLKVADPSGGAAWLIPPSAVAAGIIAAREQQLGLPWGPANELAVSAVTATDVVTDPVHDQLHRLGINVFRAERDGFRLTAARTLSTDPGYRQLSVRRLMTMICLTLERESQWLVFEPNTPNLRSTLRHVLTQFLADMFRGGAFAGATEAQSFFVRCDDSLNSAPVQALGRLIAEIGVAPASPLEYLILRLTQDADGGVQVVSGT